MQKRGSIKKERIIAGAVVATVLAAMLAVMVLVGRPLIEFASEPEHFRAWIDEKGTWGPVIYAAIVFLQVIVAIIPGEPFEIAGGYAFGAVRGTVFCLIGAALGSALVFLLIKRFGTRLVEIFFPQKKLSELRFLQTSPRRSFLFFVIFAIPGTPKDLLCYFAGLTDMKLWVWLLITTVGRLPSIVTSTIGGAALGEESYLTALAVFIATVAVSMLGLLIYRLICKRHEKKPVPKANGQGTDS